MDPELKYHNRKVPAFADDSNGALKRDAENLSRVKDVLLDFGRISGLKTNVEKTTLMPVGCLDEPLDDDIINLGFEIVEEIKCLGVKINNRASNLECNFDPICGKIRQLIGSWDRFNLSLTGKICVAKTMLLSQIGYLGCIITPSAEQIRIKQDLIDSYVTKGIVIAADRLYTKPKKGGLGLIRLESYITALQCSWIKRCSIIINDTWRWNLGMACGFVFSNLRSGSVNRAESPIAANIVQSLVRFQEKYYTVNENFLQAHLVDNRMFLRAPPERRAPVRGVVDRNLLGAAFYDRHKETLLNLKLNCLVNNNVVVDYCTLIDSTGLNFSQATYFNLVTAANFALKKYANIDGSNGSSESLEWFLSQIKKGSKKFRSILDKNSNTVEIVELRIVKTFYSLLNVTVPDCSVIGYRLGCWNWSFFSNRIRFFCFQFYNNSLGIKTRIAARYRNGGAVMDNFCTFCVKSRCANPAREDFAHVFFDCQSKNSTCKRIFRIYYPPGDNPAAERLTYLTGIVNGSNKTDSFYYLLTSILCNYTVWQSRMKKIVPSTVSIIEDLDNLFDSCVDVSQKISGTVTDASSPICRRWSARRHGRG